MPNEPILINLDNQSLKELTSLAHTKGFSDVSTYVKQQLLDQLSLPDAARSNKPASTTYFVLDELQTRLASLHARVKELHNQLKPLVGNELGVEHKIKKLARQVVLDTSHDPLRELLEPGLIPAKEKIAKNRKPNPAERRVPLVESTNTEQEQIGKNFPGLSGNSPPRKRHK